MATTFVIACPECDKQMKLSEELAGKKIRCKECEAVFVVKKPKAPPPKKKKEEKPLGLGADNAKKNAALDADEDDGKNPYALAASDEGIARCPFCTKELDPPDSKICLHCGFDIVKRVRAPSIAVYEPTGGEKFQWLLPGIICCFMILVLIGLSIFCMVKTKYWMTDGWFHDEDDKTKWIIRPGCFQLFNGLVTFFVCFQLGKFAFKRLIKNNRPPERAIEKDDKDED